MRLLYALSAMIIAAGGSLAGCVTGPPPAEEMTRAQTLLDQAEKAQAARYAPEDLQRAHEELNAADAADRHGEYDAARREAERAAVDADVATARAGEAQSLAALDEVRRSNAALRGAAGEEAPPDLETYPPAAPGAPLPAPPQRDQVPPPDTQSPH